MQQYKDCPLLSKCDDARTDPFFATDRLYDVEFDATFPLGGWTTVWTNLGCADGWLSLTNALSPEALKMYRLKVRAP